MPKENQRIGEMLFSRGSHLPNPSYKETQEILRKSKSMVKETNHMQKIAPAIKAIMERAGTIGKITGGAALLGTGVMGGMALEKNAVSGNRVIKAIASRVGQYSEKGKTTLNNLSTLGNSLGNGQLSKNIKPGTVEHSGARLLLSGTQSTLPKAKTVNPLVRKFVGKKLDHAADVGLKAVDEMSSVKPSVYHDLEPSTGIGDMGERQRIRRSNAKHVLKNKQESKKHDAGMSQAFDAINDFMTKTRHK